MQIIVGNLAAPDTKHLDDLKKEIDSDVWNHDGLPKRMDTLRGYVTEPPAALPQVIYIHCEAGTSSPHSPDISLTNLISLSLSLSLSLSHSLSVSL